jgi:colanic acid/amylovoran biosynthesis glycosyltransferase
LNFVGLTDSHHYSEVWKKADALHLLGEDLWNRARSRGCPQGIPHVLIPPAIDSQFFRPVARRHNQGFQPLGRPLRILSVGRLEWKKGYEYALQAMNMLKAEGIPFSYRIVGEGSYLEPLTFLRHKLGLEKEVKFLGGRNRSEVRKQMSQADIFLHTAVSEGFCNAVLEAQSMALPIVCTDADGLKENIDDGTTGFAVPARNPHQIAEKLRLLAGDSILRKKMGASGRRRVRKKFQLKDQIEAFNRFYQGILQQKAREIVLQDEK